MAKTVKNVAIFIIIAAVFAFFYFLNKKEIIWYNNVPKEYWGKFKEVSEKVSLGFKEPDFITIQSDEIIFSDYIEDEGYHLRKYKVIKANVTKHYWKRQFSVLFYDVPSENHISSKRLEISYDKKGLLFVDEVYGEGSEELELEHLGMFSKL